MLLGIHINDNEAAALRTRLRNHPWLARVRALIPPLIERDRAFSIARPGLPTPVPLRYELMTPLAHGASALALYHAIEPTPRVETVLRNFLLYTLEQEVMLLHGAFLQGQFLRGVILALDAVGQTLPDSQRRQILEHLILTTVDNPDPNAPINNRPDKNAPLRRVMEIPGTNFHIKDEHVNNWDILGAMGLLYVARATGALFPNRVSDVEKWIAVARRRAERFFTLQYTDEGEYGEGPGYFSYGTAGALMSLDLLQRWDRGAWWKQLKLNGLFASARWAREIQPREIVLGPFNFNDCSHGMLEAPTVIHWIAAHAEDTTAQNYGDELMEVSLKRLENGEMAADGVTLHDLDKLVWSLLWRDERLANRAPTGTSSRSFGRFGTVISRTGYTSNDLCLCFRCGDLAGAHTHADRGNFLLTAFGENIGAEGGKPYDRSIPEYNAYHRESRAHNVAIPKGRSQVREADGHACNGQITKFEPLADGLILRANLSEVYPEAGRVERVLRFSHRGWVLIEDFIEKPGEAIDFLLHTDNTNRTAQVTIESDRVLIKRPKASLVVFPLLPATIIDDGTHFQDSDREGLRSLILRRADQRMLTLLVVTRAGEESRVRIETAGARQWKLAMGSHSELISLP